MLIIQEGVLTSQGKMLKTLPTRWCICLAFLRKLSLKEILVLEAICLSNRTASKDCSLGVIRDAINNLLMIFLQEEIAPLVFLLAK